MGFVGIPLTSKRHDTAPLEDVLEIQDHPGTDPADDTFSPIDLTGATVRCLVADQEGTPVFGGTATVIGLTTTSGSFLQPAVGADDVVAVADTSWMSPGERVLVAGGGYYTVVAIGSGSSVTLRNTGDPRNAAPGTTVASGATVTNGAVQYRPTPDQAAYSRFTVDDFPLRLRLEWEVTYPSGIIQTTPSGKDYRKLVVGLDLG